jgi:hypothetical protein
MRPSAAFDLGASGEEAVTEETRVLKLYFLFMLSENMVLRTAK